jgi:uncharacterized OB-fold protein
MPGTLRAPLKVEFDYTRSLGPVLSRFMTGLRDRTILGSRGSDGRVAVPPLEYDPVSHQPTSDLVPVGPGGTVTTWTWVSEPVDGQPFDRPFAFALVLLDGADVPMLHAVDAPSPDAMHTGMRVTAAWADDPQGHIRDLWFVPEAASEVEPVETTEPGVSTSSTSRGDVAGIVTPVNLSYTYAASSEESAFFRGLAEGRILGQRCPKCGKVYVPPRGACPVDGVPTAEEVELPDRGIVTTFCIVNVPFLGQRIEPPYVSAYVLLDGADIAFLHLILGCEASEVRMGMRVEAVWKPRDQWGTTIENIDHFRPTGEPDAPFESYANHL